MKVIALSGFKRSGKDTTAEILKSIYEEKGRSVEIVAFADAIYEMLSDECGLSPEELKSMERTDLVSFEGEECSIRFALNSIGEVVKKNMGYDFWLNIVKKKYKESKADYFIVTDVRFKKEIEWIETLKKQKKAKHFCVFRKEALPEWLNQGLMPNKSWELSIIKKDFKEDVSEYQWLNWARFNGWIKNDGSFDDLKEDIQNKIDTGWN